MAWEVYVEREKFVCAQSDYKYRCHDRTDYHQNTIERPRTLDPTECKQAIRHMLFAFVLNSTLKEKAVCRELKYFSNCVLSTKMFSGNLQHLGKTISSEVKSKYSFELLSNSPYKSLRIGLHENMLN